MGDWKIRQKENKFLFPILFSVSVAAPVHLSKVKAESFPKMQAVYCMWRNKGGATMIFFVVSIALVVICCGPSSHR